MDWYFDIVVLIGTFCVIAIGMTIYARLNPTRPRVRRGHYIYTGIIPTITISAADSPTKRSPTTLTPADSLDGDEQKPSNSESALNDAELLRQLKCQNNRLSIPVLDDDDEDEEEQQQSVQPEDVPVSVSTTLNRLENNERETHVTSSLPNNTVETDKSHSQTASLETLPSENESNLKHESPPIIVANVLEEDKNNVEVRLDKDEVDEEQLSDSMLLFNKSDEDEISHTASLSSNDNLDADLSDKIDLSDVIATLDDLRASPISNQDDSEIYPHKISDLNEIPTGTSFGKIGSSHTVEEPLFPFSEILEEEHPSTRNRFKKRLSQ